MGLPLVPMTESWPADTKLFVRGTTATRKGHSAQLDAPPGQERLRAPLSAERCVDRILPYRVANAASNEAVGGSKASLLMNASASGAPTSRSIPASSHSTEMGPPYPMVLSIRKLSSHGTSP